MLGSAATASWRDTGCAPRTSLCGFKRGSPRAAISEYMVYPAKVARLSGSPDLPPRHGAFTEPLVVRPARGGAATIKLE